MRNWNAITYTRWGPMLYHRYDTICGALLDRYGDFSLDESRFLLALIEPGDNVLDGGANIGAHAIPLGHKVRDGDGLVLAIEPQFPTFNVLCGNVALNSLDHTVKPVMAALAAAEHQAVYFPLLNPSKPNNVGGIEAIADKKDGHYAVSTTTIDRLTEKLPTLDLLKLDLEGAEPEALRGAQVTLERCQPYCYVEIDRGLDHEAAVRAVLEPMGYTCFTHCPSYYSPANFRHDPQDVMPGIVSVNLFGCPPNREPPEGEWGLT